MFVASHLSGVKTPIQFMPLKSDLAPIQSMPLSIPKSDPSSCYGPIRMQRSIMPSTSLRLRCEAIKYNVVQSQNFDGTPYENKFNCVIKFGSSSVDSAYGMIKIVNFICILDRTIVSFEERRLVIVLSAMGETTNKLLLAGKNAVSCDISNVPDIEEWTFVKDLHLRTADELGIDREMVSERLFGLEQILKMIASLKELNELTEEYLVSMGVFMSTIIFAAYLNKIGIKFKQFDSHEIGIITTHDLTNVDIIEANYPSDWINDPAIPIITSSLGKSMKPAKEGDKSVQVKISYNPKAPETDTNGDIDISFVPDRNAIMPDITKMFCQFVRISKVYMLMFLLRVKRVADDWLSNF